MISGTFIDQTVENFLKMTKLIVCLTGMPGAGKSTIAQGLKSKGLQVINMGDAVRTEAKKRNLEPTGQNLGKLMLELREKNGQGAVAKLIKPLILQSHSNVIVIDGIRSNAELEILQKIGKVRLLSVLASSDTRFKFLKTRGRIDDPKTKNVFDERDKRELSVGISSSIASADESVSNNNLTKEELIEAVYKIIKSWTE
jgi:dephospho-CoA kinase